MFEKEYKVQMPMSGLATSWFERGKGEKFAWLDYDVKKLLKWNMKVYSDEAKKDAFLEANEGKIASLGGKPGYEIKDLKSGQVLGAWVKTKRFLNLFLNAPFTLYVDGQVVAKAPGESFFKLMVPAFIRKMTPRKVVDANGKVVAKVSKQAALGCGVVKVKPEGGTIEDAKLATAIAVLAGIVGLDD